MFWGWGAEDDDMSKRISTQSFVLVNLCIFFRIISMISSCPMSMSVQSFIYLVIGFMPLHSHCIHSTRKHFQYDNDIARNKVPQVQNYPLQGQHSQVVDKKSCCSYSHSWLYLYCDKLSFSLLLVLTQIFSGIKCWSTNRKRLTHFGKMSFAVVTGGYFPISLLAPLGALVVMMCHYSSTFSANNEAY